MEIILQRILLPDKERYGNYDKLFYKSIQTVYDPQECRLCIACYNMCDFMAYLNAFSIKKWKKYTKINTVSLRLEAQGDFELQIVGAHLLQKSAVKKVYYTKHYCCPEREWIEVELPDMEETLAAFEVNAISDCFIYGGAYVTEVDEADCNQVVLSVATTTFRKEDFIRKNLKMIREELLTDELVGKHVYVHVVDNGRTLDRNEIESEHVYYHPNKNVGGSGGFSRGMMESLHQEPKATHVLLMDDDVEILSESIRRTYVLLLLQKEEYRDYFISGAMLKYEEMDEFHEDVGIVSREGYQIPLKSWGNVGKKEKILFNEELDIETEGTYSGWWYCCIPATVIERSGYALPVFIRVDDTEYSLRNHARFITMNGICVWHMGFLTKFNYFMEYYQVFRNFLIAGACNGDTNLQNRVMSRLLGTFLSEILRYNYAAAEFFIDAVRDFLKGPAFIEEEKCQERLEAMNKRTVVMHRVEELTDEAVDFTRVYKMDPRRLMDSILYKLTFNGQIFWPKKWVRKGYAAVAYDWFYNPQRQSFKEGVIAVNPYTQQGELRRRDTKEFRRVMREMISVMLQYRKKLEEVNEAYYNKRKYLVSEEFWRSYLEIQKYQ